MVSLRVCGDALQGVDTAQPHVELVAAQLLDRFGVTVGDLTLLGEPVGPGGHDPVFAVVLLALATWRLRRALVG
jgi:hypothetical protein